MAQPQLLQIKLSRFDAQPWGFRLQGGVDFATPLVVQKVNGGSLAEKAGLIPGDAVLRINDVDVFNLRHKDAQDVVVRSGNNFVLTVQRGGSTWRPHVTPTGNIPQPQQNSPYLQTVTKTSLAHKQQESQHIGCGYNNAARPFANGGDGNVKSIVNKQYNTPVGIYSDESIAETLSAQAEVLAGGVLGVNFKKNEKEYQPDKSEVLKFLREEETDASTPEPPVPANFYWTQSHAIGGNERRTPLSHKHQHLLQEEQPQDESIGTNLQENKIAPSSAQRPSFAQSAKPSSSEPADPRVIIMPVCPALQGPEYKAEMEAAAAALQHDDGPRPFSASGHPACALCGVGIVGVFVRIKDKNLHVECFKCATCGTSLKNQGYYNYNNKLYCDIHAKLAALQNPPPGTDGYVPVPIKPNTKLSANTISSALNAHGFSEIPVANGGSVAPPTAPQVAKPAETLDPPPPVTPDSLSTSQASTAISSTIANSTLLNTTNNINSSNNNKESEQLEGATQSIHGKSTNFSSGMLANPSSALDTSSNKQPFGEYVTLTGSVIRSVVPPGKGVNINYKVNQGYARPFGAAPAVAPKSPVAYPPQRPAINPYATLPRTNVGQQDSDASLQPQYAEEFHSTAAPDYFEEDYELSEVNRQNRSNFSWPPPKEDSPIVPTAAPLYIPPPETQHVFAKAANVSHSQKEDEVVNKTSLHADEIKDNGHEQTIKQYLRSNRQNKSAPHLTIDLQPPEIESSSESFTSTSTTTTTTSEEYQRMYAAQVQAYQMQQIYEQQSGSELDYHIDMEVATMQQHPQDSSCISSSEYICGRRSAQECVESLVAPLNTNKLIEMVREVTPSPVPLPNIQGNRHVVFIDEPETKEIPSYSDEEYKSQTLAKSGTVSSDATVPSDSLLGSETFVKTENAVVQESQRIFQPTSEIKIEIAPVRQLPPSKIPNPVPKEWINPMVRVLTTAPDVPFHLVECPCPKPCDNDSFESLEQDRAPQETVKTQDAKEMVYAEEILPIEETPPKGSWLANAITTAPEWEVRFEPPPSQIITLPEETKPYMPPPIDMKPYMREDYRPKSPFLSALTTAPERPFEGHFERDVPIHLLDLPTPKEHLTLSDALCTAPERAYTPLNPENATNVFEKQEIEKNKKKQEFQVLNREEELGIKALDSESIEYYTTERRDFSQHRKSSAFAAMQAFQPTQEPLISNTPRQSIASYTKEDFDPDYEGYYKAKERNKKRIDYYHKKEEELQQQHIEPIKNQKISETNTCQMSSLNSYTKRNSSSESSSAVQAMSNTTSTSTYDSNSTHALRSSYQNNTRTVKSDVKVDLHEVIEETTEELEHSDVLFPPPSPLSHLHGKSASSGLHKADTIPKYQRNWTVLPNQSPARTPEPPELRENIPLAFVDAPVTSSSSNPVHKPVAQSCTTIAVSQQYQQQHEKISSANRGSIKSTSSKSSSQEQSKLLIQNKKPIVPIIIEEKIAPQVTMAFQSLDEHLQTDESQTLSRPYTPSISSKPVPVIPYYQTPEALCFDECPATHARNYDRRSASPFPDRARSPAPGPPTNPLAAIRSPKPIDNKISSLSPLILQAGSITTGQSYLGAQQQLQQQQQQQTQILSHYEQAISTGSQSCINKPGTIKTCEIGDYKVQSTEKEVQKVHQNQSKLDSQTKIQIGDTQIESRRRVTEEYEHTQSARSVEIRTDSKTIKSSPASERRQSYGKTGYVANQARRLSGLEQEITNLTSQSQAISARAATLTETSFPQIKSPEPSSKFPTKPVLPPHDEPQRPNYLFSATPYNKMVGPPPGFSEQQQQLSPAIHLSSAYGSSVVSQQQQSLSTYSSSNFTSSTSKTSSLSSQANATNVGSLTKASITNNNIAGAASARTTGASAVCPVTGTFCRPGHTCCRQQQLQTQSSATDVVNYNQNNNLTYRTNASTGLTDIKTNAQATAIATANAANAIDTGASQAPHTATAAAATATATTSFPPPNTVDKNKSNAGLDGLTGVGGKGAFGATSAPKRGRGIFNKAVGPGVRVPLCSSCNIQIRGPFITALGRIWCPEHFICVNANCRRPLQDIGFVEEKGDLYCEYCFEKYLAPTCSKCGSKIKGDCLNAIGKQFHPECFTCGHCGKLFGNTPFFLEDGNAYCEADWNELFTTKCFACGFPVEAGDRWVEALNHNYHSQCFNCTYCKQNLEGQSFYNKGGRPFCKNHAR
ncbi:PREDICTED: PDZ and LIM domain protein Zasp isoform X3 [Bactrocera latifrons]|uniref:PDZ and LIM domain protein Zasp isoform X3 n=1 Tax=Bactrocera latifrons TaxID=174628 RepID=UPI0008DD2BC7|nr:PREDICTED: PDZ and LIM domain protein Zasp isoform X3 [Bactrocera latifrons]